MTSPEPGALGQADTTFDRNPRNAGTQSAQIGMATELDLPEILAPRVR